MQPQKIDLGRLQASAQPRPINPADIDRLAASIKQIGLIQPVTVRQVPGIYRGLAEQVFQIVAGHHRVAAVRSLGWTEIDAIVIETTNLNAELIEIDENLVRSELTPGQRANHISRRGEICEALAPYVPVELQDGEDDMGGNEISTHHETDALGRKKSPQQTKSFAAETAKLTGESKQSINQYRAIGDALGEDALRVGGTSLDKKSELTALAKMQPEQRAPLIARAIAGEKVTARAPAAPPPSLALLLPEPEPASLADVLPWDAEPPAPPAPPAPPVPPAPPPPATDSTLADVAAIWDAALSAACKRLGCAGTGDAVLTLRELMRASPDACAAEEMQEILHDLSRWANA